MRRAGVVVAALAAYLAVAAALWWHMWALGFSHSIAAQGWGDPVQDVWFLAWVPHAIRSGLNPFVSRAMFAPKGINLVLNTSILLPSFLMYPVTLLFGPLVSFNVLVVLAPALNALAAFSVFRRWAPFAPGRWVAGLFYGFSPSILNDLMDGHLHLTILVIPPLILGVLDDLLVRRKGNPVLKGALSGLLLAAQFLTGEEVTAMIVMLVIPGLALLAIRHRAELKDRDLRQRAAAGGLAAATVAIILLAYPFYELVYGPRRFTGSVFNSPYGYVVWLKALLWPIGGNPPTHWAAYVGIPLIVLIAVGCWRIRSGALRFAVSMAAIALIYALGRELHWTPAVNLHLPLPDAIFSHWPLVKNLLPVRFAGMVDLFLAMALAIVLDRVWAAATARLSAPLEHPARRRRPVAAATAAVAAIGLGCLALVSPVLGSPVPFSSRVLDVPAVYQSAALTQLPRGTILLGYPIPNGFLADPMYWQAAEAMPYDSIAGYGFIPGPGPDPIGSVPKSVPAALVFADAQVGLLPPVPSPATVRAVRKDLEAWQVSVVVEYKYGQLDQPKRLAKILDEATGVKPRHLDGARVWMIPRR